MHRIGLDGPSRTLDADKIRAVYEFPAIRPWVRASMVATLDGVI